MVTSPVCSELLDRAARAAWEVWTEEPCEMAMSTWCRVVDAVAEVLAEHHLTAGDEVTICEVTIRRQAWVKRLGNAAGRLVIVPEDQGDLITERDEALGLLREVSRLANDNEAPRHPDQWRMESEALLVKIEALVERVGPAGAHPAGSKD